MMAMLTRRALAISIALLLTGAAGPPARSQGVGTPPSTAAEPIGNCWMEPDGTIVVVLRRTADGINVSMPPRRYPPSDPHYAAVLAHVGPLKPGESRLVMPWP